LRPARRRFIPVTIGGGMRSPEGVDRALRSGADKVSLNTAAVARPEVLTECAARFGCQCVVASIDARRERGGWRVYTHGGRAPTDLEAGGWAQGGGRVGGGEKPAPRIEPEGGCAGVYVGVWGAGEG